MKKEKQTEVFKRIVLMFMLFMSTWGSFAQDTIDGKISAWGEQLKTTLDIATAIFALVGGFLIFFQYMQGNDQAQKNFIKFIIGLAIVGLVNLIVRMFIPTAPDLGGSTT